MYGSVCPADSLCYMFEKKVHYAALKSLHEAPVKHHKNLRLMNEGVYDRV